MEFYEKLQKLRKQKGLTQEQLAEQLYVSRTAISKWESNRGYPSIDSLKEISRFFQISLDDLLSGEEILAAAKEDNRLKLQYFRDIIFGLLDCSVMMFFFMPLFGEKSGEVIAGVSLLSLSQTPAYVKIPYFIVTIALIVCGILTLTLQNYMQTVWTNIKDKASLGLSTIAMLIFMISSQPYAGVFVFSFLIIKALMLVKWA